ncbi:MAG: DUF4242 domain-containing protein [Hyphomicrobiales bacterium]
MTLFLIEFDTTRPGASDAPRVLSDASAAATKAGGEVIESHIAPSLNRAYLVVEHDRENGLRAGLAVANLPEHDVAQVRLVGATLEEVKANRSTPGFLVEWDLPKGLEMDQYLARKKEKSPLYAQVPEVSFRRTYVREDMMKCLCMYDAPDEDAVRHAREVVSTPVDRLGRLEAPAPVQGQS